MKHDGVPPCADGDRPVPLALLIETAPAPASDRLLTRVRTAVDRRVLVSQIATGVWIVPLTVVLQFLLLGLELLAPERAPGPGRRASRVPRPDR